MGRGRAVPRDRPAPPGPAAAADPVRGGVPRNRLLRHLRGPRVAADRQAGKPRRPGLDTDPPRGVHDPGAHSPRPLPPPSTQRAARPPASSPPHPPALATGPPPPPPPQPAP